LAIYDPKFYIGLHKKYPFFLFLSDVNETYTFSTLFENAQISNFMIICPYGAEFHADRRKAGMTKLRVALRSFCERA